MMATRTIKTTDGEEYSGGIADFLEYDDYIEHKGFLTTTKIYKRMITKDATTRNLKSTVAAGITLVIMLFGTTLAMSSVPYSEKSLASELTQEQRLQFEQEIQSLFKQKYIDPLTEYIEYYEFDDQRAPFVEQVLVERDKRCSEIEQRYQAQKHNDQTGLQLKKGYNYSCPEVVERLSQLS
ncbi:MAG: hypothetical protein SVR94_10860 [Pseudomonadota bacterium]|nr:hypothetical protein [Pseudomonadota bacterium]